jgi:hypothetical protein
MAVSKADVLNNRTFELLYTKAAPSQCDDNCHKPTQRDRDDLDQLVNAKPKGVYFTVGPPKRPATQQPHIDPTRRRINALFFGSQNPAVLLERPDQTFANYATPWELWHSTLTG